MWTYKQSTGELSHDGKLVDTGYAGMDQGKNNPAMQDVHGVGPLPRGKYSIGAPQNMQRFGPHVLRLWPDANNEMFGRAGFLIHADSVTHPGRASEGCIVVSFAARKAIGESRDPHLTVEE